MLIHQIRSLQGAVSLAREEIRNLCEKHRTPVIPVEWDRDKLPVGARAAFSISEVRIMISRQIIDLTYGEPEHARVWAVMSNTAHEFTHYRQYLKGAKNQSDFDESEAYREGRHYADSRLADMSKEEINPKSLYESFHGNPPKEVRKVNFTVPKRLTMIGRLIEVIYAPNSNSKHHGVHFSHKWGDTGEEMRKDKPILATDGKNFYILNDEATPTFTERGIIG